MKIHKLIEIWKELEKGVQMDENGLMKRDPEEFLNDIQFLDRCARRAGYHYTLAEPQAAKGIFKLCAVGLEKSEKDGVQETKPVAAEVKLWDNKEHRIASRFSLRRMVTDENGRMEKEIPCGEYDAEISCGPEYTVQIIPIKIEEGKTCEVKAALKRVSGLTREGWLAGDLHHHSIYSSPAYGGTDPVIESPHEVCLSMKSKGMQFGALSDHHNTLNHDEWKRETKDFTPIISKEISTSNGHVLSLGVEKDVIYDIPKGKDRTSEALRSEFIRICREIREEGGLPQVNHPFDASSSTRYNSEFFDMIEIFESIEIWNGATPFMEGTFNSKTFHAWLRFLDEGKYLTATAGSDTHNIYGDDYFGMIEWINWLMSVIIEHPEVYPEQMRGQVDYLTALYEKVFPVLEKWVARSNSPSNIHNYVYTGEKNSQKEILDAIRAGKVFVSSGPLLVPSVNKAGIGEHASLKNGIGTLSVSLLCREPVAHLYLYTGAESRTELTLTEKRTEDGFYDYSAQWEAYEFGDAKWAVLYAENGPDCAAVTNPIYLNKVSEG